MSGRRTAGAWLCAAALGAGAGATPSSAIAAAQNSADAPLARRVAVVINDDHEGSRTVGEYYAKRRSIPSAHVIRIRTTAGDSIDRAAYVRTIEEPIAAALARGGLQDRILYLVLTTGVPLRINGTGGQEGTLSSVDSELTLLYRRMTGQPAGAQASIENPYFLGGKPISEARPFSRRDHDIYLVTRLDAFTVEEARALVDRGVSSGAAAAGGRIVLDQRGSPAGRLGDGWMDEAHARLRDSGHAGRVVLESTPQVTAQADDVVGYFSWGSTDPENRRRRTGLTFAAGALAANIVGSDARTFREPPADWTPGAVRRPLHAGTSESLVGDLIREGVTGIAGSVADPSFAGSVRPQILFPAYLAGFNLAEAFYLSVPRLSWRLIVVGDPLAAVASRGAVAAVDTDDWLDPVTELPALFSARRVKVAAAQGGGVAEPAAALALRAEMLASRDDMEGARAALTDAVTLAPGYASALLRLALLEDQTGRPEAAAARYRQVLEIQPGNVIALNNLAFALAANDDTRREALTLARRAAVVAPTDPNVLDTFAWVNHLLGDSAEAARVMTQVLRAAPDRAIIRLHAAVIFASTRQTAAAEAQLKEALRLDPSLESSEEVRGVREALQ